MEPREPSAVSPYARACLEALSAEGCGELISLCGALALAYYHEYRPTADVDAWWTDRAGRGERARVIHVLQRTLSTFGAVRTRSWGDVTSVELVPEGRVTFSVQIAQSSARLRAPIRAPWPAGLLVDSFEDVMASKMEALVNRGAPRDLRDVHAVCSEGLSTPDDLWVLWERRREAAGENADRSLAALAVRTHLERIELARPLQDIADAAQRESAGAVRAWFEERFLAGLV